MKLEDLEKYRREDGHIDFNSILKSGEFGDLGKYINENGDIDINSIFKDRVIGFDRETEGSQNRDKFWVTLDDTQVMLRTNNLSNENVEYITYAELIVEELAKQVNMPCAHYDLVEFNGQKGIITKNILERQKESIISAQTLLVSYDTKNKDKNIGDPINIEELFSAFSLFKYDDLSKEEIQEARVMLAKKAVFESFTMATDSHSNDIIFVFYSDGETKSAKLFPLIDNEHSLMLQQPLELIDEMLDKPGLLEIYERLQDPLIVAPNDYKEELIEQEEIYYKMLGEKPPEHCDWQFITEYLCDDDIMGEECREFAEKCSEKLDIGKAIECVEEKVHCKLPDKLKEFVTKAFELRKEKVEQFLGIEKEDIELW